ncbi:MAG: dihydrofolate reductase family protein [Thermaceae bacterium]|nr:dihydrofolate reductase family protein [Thermaceae bacterium]
MRKLIMQLELTLDGFYAGPNEEFDWFRLDPDQWKMKVDLFSTIDTVLLGRKNYVGFGSYWPSVVNNPASTETDIKFSRWLDEVPKVVFSKTLAKAQWQNSRLVGGDVAGEVSRLKGRSGKNLLIMSSTSIAQECMKHDLIDEYWLGIHPVALGEGLALFKERVNLKLLDSKTFPSGQIFLYYARQRA